ncbi:hypothetical protein ACFWN1_26500 [Streptomyces sp. NPDC058459]|uniref:hypothetical protein n=1 Tax=Streptomyces sp. NPDC058459 TaxID=3346508 RepID=UPI00366506AC
MSTTPTTRKVAALLALAYGKPIRYAAGMAEVAPSTVSVWKKEPAFAAELAAVRQVYERDPRNWEALVARLDEAEQRLRPPGMHVDRGGTIRVRALIPAGSSPAQVRRLAGRAVARGMRAAAREAQQ